ncbi:KinB-signaling pathway activation protein [Macrococcus equipercicus]|uniref:KinB-signaling pathway activation protein n=1 Tax=Macrococcus equipercicus TaxID=69967 RepID=A0A9Q9BMA2_9STAP|nr:KinB-signaling pathway activation protein [Macrococcus equipercicus]KAA1037650.1 hypothetical protein ERX35_009750 [Macrococcus equipercicus]UTH14163.1 KinB-signaling pathway activation protein [Macrococcus equipercicus]
MTIRNLGKFYGMTLLLGLIATLLVSLIFGYDRLTVYLFKGQFGDFIAAFIWFIGYGLLIASISQLAYFSYLFIHQLGAGIFRSAWNPIQAVITIFALFDLIYFRYLRFGRHAGDIQHFIWIPILILIAAVIVSYYKVKLTKTNVVIPAMFFMIVMTTVELIPFLRVEDTTWLYCTIFPLLLCNAYQLLVLPKYNKASRQERYARKVAKGEIKPEEKVQVKNTKVSARKNKKK